MLAAPLLLYLHLPPTLLPLSSPSDGPSGEGFLATLAKLVLDPTNYHHLIYFIALITIGIELMDLVEVVWNHNLPILIIPDS